MPFSPGRLLKIPRQGRLAAIFPNSEPFPVSGSFFPPFSPFAWNFVTSGVFSLAQARGFSGWVRQGGSKVPRCILSILSLQLVQGRCSWGFFSGDYVRDDRDKEDYKRYAVSIINRKLKDLEKKGFKDKEKLEKFLKEWNPKASKKYIKEFFDTFEKNLDN